MVTVDNEDLPGGATTIGCPGVRPKATQRAGLADPAYSTRRAGATGSTSHAAS